MLERSYRCASTPPTSMPYFSTRRKPAHVPRVSYRFGSVGMRRGRRTGGRLARAGDDALPPELARLSSTLRDLFTFTRQPARSRSA